MAGRPKTRARREAAGLPVAPRRPYLEPIDPPPRERAYDYDEAAALCLYSPDTIRRMAGDGTLQRGRDFIVWRYRSGRWVRRVRLITEQGIDTLRARYGAGIRSNHGPDTRGSIT